MPPGSPKTRSVCADPVIDLGGTIRSDVPANTLARTRGLRREFGITRLANVTGLDHVGVPTWMAVRPLARSLSVSQGKGLTDELAQASAIMECIELHHAEHFLPRGRMRTLSRALDSEGHANPLLLPVDPSAELDPDLAVEWIAGTDMVSQQRAWIPRDCLDIDSVSRRRTARVFVGSSNGLASGNTIDEATLHALCEVIERDQASFWYARKRLAIDASSSRLHLDSVTDPHCRWLIERCRDAGVEVMVWHATHNLVLPCFVCTIFDSQAQTFYPQRATGSGCHPYRRVALARALCEALQSRLTHVAGGRDDMYWSLYRGELRVDSDSGRQWGGELLDEAQGVAYDEVPEAAVAVSLGALVDWTLAVLRDNDLQQVIRIDLSQPAIGIPVVHVSVPGLETYMPDAHYTPGPRMRQLMGERIPT